MEAPNIWEQLFLLRDALKMYIIALVRLNELEF